MFFYATYTKLHHYVVLTLLGGAEHTSVNWDLASVMCSWVKVTTTRQVRNSALKVGLSYDNDLSRLLGRILVVDRRCRNPDDWNLKINYGLFNWFKSEDWRISVLMFLSCNLHDNSFLYSSWLVGLYHGLSWSCQKTWSCWWSWSCQDLLVLPDVLVLLSGSTVMFLVLGIKGI